MLRGLLIILLLTGWCYAACYYVQAGGSNGNGTLQDPFNHPQAALQAAMPGDSILVLPGVFSFTNSLYTVRDGAAGQPIVLAAYDAGQPPVFSADGTVMTISHAYFILKGAVLDGQMGSGDVLRINGGGDHARIDGCEIRYGVRDGIDLHRADHVVIENCHIHHFLAGSYANQQDAHGIVATNQKHLIIRNCDIHHVSGDCFQTDPNRSQPLWDDVLLENCRLWTGPLDADYAAWNAGEVPGENAVDTKICTDSLQLGYRPVIRLKQIEAFGFTPGYISNRAALNIKEQVDCRLEAVTVYQSEIAFRLRGDTGRGSAHVTMMNCLAYGNEKVFRVEDGVAVLRILNSTFDAGSGIYFKKVSGGYLTGGFEMKNCLFVGSKPSDAGHWSNLGVQLAEFADPGGGDYHLVSGSAAIDAGEDIADVLTDFDGEPRTPGAYDVGADEYSAASGVTEPGMLVAEAAVLGNAYPNPFNPSTQILVEVARAVSVRLDIYNLLGQRVATVWNGHLPPGRHRFEWDGRNDAETAVSAGVFFAVMITGHRLQIRKLILAR